MTGKPLVNITVYDDGDFDLFLPGKNKPLDAEPQEKSMLRVIKDPTTDKLLPGSFVNPLLTYLKTGSGWIIIGGRRYWIP